MFYGNIPNTSRTSRPSSFDFLSNNSSNPSVQLKSHRIMNSTDEAQETFKLKKEIQILKKNLRTANKELEEIKAIHEREVTQLKKALELVKQEIQILKEEKVESLALQSYGVDEYGSLAHEVIKLRTEIDRVTYLYNKEKRGKVLRKSESND